MPSCRICKQNYPQSQFVSGNGPRYLTCVRCAVEQGMVDSEEVPQLYSDELVNARMGLFSRRYAPWILVILGWTLFFSFGSNIGVWSNIFLVVIILWTLITPVIHFLGTARFKAKLIRLTP
ncbi:MAG: hypothetical protein HN533_05870 [Euryarchaeota archaeon]|jgi:hypothetical protein|nr:hypothetical protein [Euryarchaeota archaeon]MBT6684069.1 hypothetical protein [Euryarchaeota archaeon]MBT6873927.1 hypothetical protein [Euryarchaeota archaeon]